VSNTQHPPETQEALEFPAVRRQTTRDENGAPIGLNEMSQALLSLLPESMKLQ
jgi:hypothetical protein